MLQIISIIQKGKFIMPEKIKSIRLNNDEQIMLNELIKKYSEENKGLKITSSTIIRLSLIHEYEKQQNNR